LYINRGIINEFTGFYQPYTLYLVYAYSQRNIDRRQKQNFTSTIKNSDSHRIVKTEKIVEAPKMRVIEKTKIGCEKFPVQNFCSAYRKTGDYEKARCFLGLFLILENYVLDIINVLHM
jgi:hypothetical protein